MPDAPAADPERTTQARCFVAIVASLFVLYNLNFREIGILDPVPATLLPASLLTEGDADLDESASCWRRTSTGVPPWGSAPFRNATATW